MGTFYEPSNSMMEPKVNLIKHIDISYELHTNMIFCTPVAENIADFLKKGDSSSWPIEKNTLHMV